MNVYSYGAAGLVLLIQGLGYYWNPVPECIAATSGILAIFPLVYMIILKVNNPSVLASPKPSLVVTGSQVHLLEQPVIDSTIFKVILQVIHVITFTLIALTTVQAMFESIKAPTSLGETEQLVYVPNGNYRIKMRTNCTHPSTELT